MVRPSQILSQLQQQSQTELKQPTAKTQRLAQDLRMRVKPAQTLSTLPGASCQQIFHAGAR
jgi:hypothetical protein